MRSKRIPLRCGFPACSRFFASVAAGLLLGAVPAMPDQWEDYYTLETIEPPEGVVAEVGGIDVLEDGRLVFGFERGEVYFYDPEDGSWARFAEGLHHTLGVIARSEREVIVTQRPEVTRLLDTTGDGKADRFDVLTDRFGLAGNHSEFNFGLVEDARGNLYFSPGTLSGGLDVRYRVRGEISEPGLHGRMFSAVPYRGWVLKLTPEGELIPYASGLRNANGLLIDDRGRLIVSDNEGDWVGTSGLYHVERSNFYGHAPSLVWREGWDRGIPADLGPEALDEMRERPIVRFPHGILSNSPSQPVQDNTGGAFGPFEGQIFIGELNHRHLIRFMPDEVDGRIQGAATRFHAGHGLRRGNNRLAFAPDGSLWTGQTERRHGWVGGTGIHRLSWTGQVPLEVLQVTLLSDGFEVRFTRPIDPESAGELRDSSVERFTYLYHERYGSPQVDNTRLAVRDLRVGEEADRIELILGEEAMVPGLIYALDFSSLRGAEGRRVMHPEVWYSLERLRNGAGAAVVEGE
jgi:hypothetical protein